MSDNKRNINTSIGKTLDYLRDFLGGKERNALERNLERDPFEKDAMEGFQSLNADDLEADFNELNKKLSRRVTKSNRVLVYRVAAGIAIILTLSISYLMVFDKQIDEFPENLQVSERVEKEDKAGDKSIQIPEMDSKQLEAYPVEDDTNKVETLPEKKGPATENKKSMNNEAVKAIAEKSTITMVIALEEDKDLEEFTMEFSEENEVAVIEEPLEVVAFQSNAEKGQGTEAEKISEPAAEVVEYEFAREMSASRAKKSAATPSVSRDDSTVLPDLINYPELSDSDLTIEEVVIVGFDKKNEASDYSTAKPEMGMRKYRNYLEQNIQIKDSVTEKTRLTVILKFVINEKGKAEEFRIVESPDTIFSKEAIRLVEEGPVWIPAKKSETYSAGEIILRIVFKN